MVQDYAEEKAGRTVFRGHGVFGWDAKLKTYTWYWCDSMGQPPGEASRGHWQGDTLTFESTQPQGRGRYTFRFEGDDSYHFKIENSFDGGATWVMLMEGTYRRRPSP